MHWKFVSLFNVIIHQLSSHRSDFKWKIYKHNGQQAAAPVVRGYLFASAAHTFSPNTNWFWLLLSVLSKSSTAGKLQGGQKCLQVVADSVVHLFRRWPFQPASSVRDAGANEPWAVQIAAAAARRMQGQPWQLSSRRFKAPLCWPGWGALQQLHGGSMIPSAFNALQGRDQSAEAETGQILQVSLAGPALTLAPDNGGHGQPTHQCNRGALVHKRSQWLTITWLKGVRLFPGPEAPLSTRVGAVCKRWLRNVLVQIIWFSRGMGPIVYTAESRPWMPIGLQLMDIIYEAMERDTGRGKGSMASIAGFGHPYQRGVPWYWIHEVHKWRKGKRLYGIYGWISAIDTNWVSIDGFHLWKPLLEWT